jgi:hypothetical protein
VTWIIVIAAALVLLHLAGGLYSHRRAPPGRAEPAAVLVAGPRMVRVGAAARRVPRRAPPLDADHLTACPVPYR